IFFLPIYLQLGHKVSPQLSGLLLLPVTAGMVVASITSSRILARTGRPHWIPVSGMASSATALLLLGLLPPRFDLIIVLVFFSGLGFGTVMPTTQLTVQTVAGREKLGAATAIVALARSTGGAAGAALFGAIVFAMLPQPDALGGDAATVTAAFHRAYLIL